MATVDSSYHANHSAPQVCVLAFRRAGASLVSFSTARGEKKVANHHKDAMVERSIVRLKKSMDPHTARGR